MKLWQPVHDQQTCVFKYSRLKVLQKSLIIYNLLHVTCSLVKVFSTLSAGEAQGNDTV